MKTIIVVALLVLAVVALPTREEFNAWAAKHQKVYGTAAENDRRFHIYTSNWYRVQRLNTEGKGQFSLDNKFADMLPSEFKKTFLHPFVLPEVAPVDTMYMGELKDPLPDNFNWVEQNAVVGVKDQGQCGSCWAFSAVANMESANFLHGTKELIPLSESQLVDCDKGDEGCNGGLMGNAFEYAIQNGMESEKDYPYKAVTSTCKYAKAKATVHFSNWTMIEQDEEKMRQALYEHGPLSIAVDAENWSYYSGGIYDSSCTTNLDHGVTLVGWGTEGSKPYWIIKNSWGTSWGKEGYIWLARGKNKCGVKKYVATILV